MKSLAERIGALKSTLLKTRPSSSPVVREIESILADVRELERCAWEVVHCREEETGRAISDLLTSLTKTKGST